MADLKISQLTGATTPLAGTEVLPIVQSNTTKKVSVADLTAGRDTSVKKLTATDDVIISIAGKGVDFSANAHAAGMTSEKLTWYEEGNWTPTTNGDATGAFSGTPAGKYTRIGNVVIVSGFFIVATNFTSNKIGGLPFTCIGGFGGTGTNFSSAVLTFGSTTSIFASVNGSATTVEFASQTYPTGHNPDTTVLAYKFTLTYMTS